MGKKVCLNQLWGIIIISLMFSIASLSMVSAGVWNSTFDNSILSYWGFDDGSGINLKDSISSYNGTLINSPNWITGKSETALQFNWASAQYVNVSNTIGYNLTTAFTISTWVRLNETNANYAKIINKGNFIDSSGGWSLGLDRVSFDGKWTATIDNGGPGEFAAGGNSTLIGWQFIVMTKNKTGIYLYQNGTLVGSDISGANITANTSFPIKIGRSDYSSPELMQINGSVDEIGIWNRSLSASEIISLWDNGIGIFYLDSVNLNSPADNSIALNPITFNITSRNKAGLSNISLYIDGLFNGSISVTGFINTTTFSRTLSYGNHTWHAVSRDVSNGIATSLTRTINASVWIENSRAYTSSVTESSLQKFTLNISLANGAYTSISAKLRYNNTNYSSTATGYGDNYILTNTITVPIVSGEESKSFYWDITIDGKTYSTTASSQTIGVLQFGICNTTLNIKVINFTSKNAQNPFPILNSSFKVTWQISTSSTGSQKSYVYEDIQEMNSSFTFCTATNVTLYANANIEYDAEGYAQNYYYLTNAVLTNITSNISLYLLNDSKAALVELFVRDGSQYPLQDVIIQIQFYDVGTGTYYTTSMAKTGDNGKDIVYLNWYNSLYKFILTRNGEVIKSTSPYKISETPQIFDILSTIDFSFNKFQDFVYSLTFNNATGTFVLTFTKPSGLVDQGCLRVIKRTALNDTQICLTCETSSSATVYCNINAYGNGTYIATFYATGSWYLLGMLETTIGGRFADSIYDLLGVDDANFYAFLFTGIVMVFFLITPVLGIVGILVGLLGASALGFTPISYSIFLGLTLIGGLIIWILKR